MRLRLFPVLLSIFLALGLYLVALAIDRWLVPAVVAVARMYFNAVR